MIIFEFLLLFGALFLSALFSGSETGFFCVSRVRLVLDGLDGDTYSKRLLWVGNNPALFVATALIGNNIANYLIAMSIGLITTSLIQINSEWVHLLATLIVAPVVFIYGEAFPKTLFMRAPTTMLRVFGWLFGLLGLFILPLTCILWAISWSLERLLGKSPEKVRLALARNELADVLVEGHEMGILEPAQHELAQSLFEVANQTVRRIYVPMKNIKSISLRDTASSAMKQARRWSTSVLPVKGDQGNLIGYVRAVDLYLQQTEPIRNPRSLMSVHIDDMLIGVLMKMQTEEEPVAIVLNEQERPVGLVFEDQLAQILGVDFGNRTRSET